MEKFHFFEEFLKANYLQKMCWFRWIFTMTSNSSILQIFLDTPNTSIKTNGSHLGTWTLWNIIIATNCSTKLCYNNRALVNKFEGKARLFLVIKREAFPLFVRLGSYSGCRLFPLKLPKNKMYSYRYHGQTSKFVNAGCLDVT